MRSIVIVLSLIATVQGKRAGAAEGSKFERVVDRGEKVSKKSAHSAVAFAPQQRLFYQTTKETLTRKLERRRIER
jgi:hypothetical protein